MHPKCHFSIFHVLKILQNTLTTNDPSTRFAKKRTSLDPEKLKIYVYQVDLHCIAERTVFPHMQSISKISDRGKENKVIIRHGLIKDFERNRHLFRVQLEKKRIDITIDSSAHDVYEDWVTDHTETVTHYISRSAHHVDQRIFSNPLNWRANSKFIRVTYHCGDVLIRPIREPSALQTTNTTPRCRRWRQNLTYVSSDDDVDWTYFISLLILISDKFFCSWRECRWASDSSCRIYWSSSYTYFLTIRETISYWSRDTEIRFPEVLQFDVHVGFAR